MNEQVWVFEKWAYILARIIIFAVLTDPYTNYVQSSLLHELFSKLHPLKLATISKKVIFYVDQTRGGH